MSLTPSQRLARYDLAKDTLGHLMANCSARIAEEEKRAVPDQGQIELIMEQRRELMALGRSLDHEDVIKLEEVIATYGPQLRQAWCRLPQ